MTRILGISAYYHDSAATLLEEGRIVAALQEERFTRQKHDSDFPKNAVARCLELGNCRLEDIDYIVFYEKPFSKFERLLETYLENSPRGIRSYLKSMPLWLKEKLWMKDGLRKELDCKAPILFGEHHESHAASAFYPSPFDRAAIFTVDGVGEWTTTSLGRGNGNSIELLEEIQFPHSLGLLYSTFTYYLGFKVNSGEYKLMGLAPFGEPKYADLIRKHLIEIRDDGSFLLNPRYFDYEVGLTMASERLCELFGEPIRKKDSGFSQKHKDLAASIQRVTEEAVLTTVRHLHQLTGEKSLCMAGGVALNCVANGRIIRESPFEHLWVQPAAGDAGGSLGAALAVWHRYLEGARQLDPSGSDMQQASLLGTAYSDQEIEGFLKSEGIPYRRLDSSTLLRETAECLAQGGVIGWFQGRMEFGPRALGNRSILADPRRPGMLDEVNRRIKYRESFRPFAPAVLEEDVSTYFNLDRPSPYMLLVSSVVESMRSEIPAVTHVDGSARIQTVNAEQNPAFYALLNAFKARTGCSVLLNTSFNVRGEPIVESPQHAYRCFMRTGIDRLVLGSCVLEKREQPTGLEEDRP